MAKIDKIIKKIEDIAPVETMQPWDNSGWQINLNNKETSRILIALDITEKTIDEAIKKKCDLIISHHPLFFNAVKNISEPFLIKAIQNNVQIYSAHTNLDTAKNGLCEYLAHKCGFDKTNTILEFVKYKNFNVEKNFDELIKTIKSVFCVNTLKVTNSNRKTYSSIAFCSGSGADFIKELSKLNIDVFITGDVKHHQALNAKNMSVIDLGHFNSEKIVVEIFQNILNNENVEIVISDEKQAWEYI